MSDATAVSRRAALGAPAAMLLGSSAPACAVQREASGARTLVAYFTRSGNTRVIAGTLQRDLGASIFEIVPAQPYPEDYEANVAQATRERNAGFQPPLKATIAKLASYDSIFLGFPIWGETAPPIIRSFLSAHNFSGKALGLFITHGGYGPGDSVEVVKAHASRARFADPFIIEADQERRTMNQVRGWLSQLQGA